MHSSPLYSDDTHPMISFIVPVYNRPQEVKELLESFLTQESTPLDYEVVVVEDGSTLPCREVCESYADKLPVRYLYQSHNTGPSGARHHGAKVAQGDIFLFLDSDVELPASYLSSLVHNLKQRPVDLFGGPDAAKEDYTVTQRAISYAMTSFFTTGGIRGGRKDQPLDKFYPRTYNMGVTRTAYEAVKGFRQDLRYGEDIDFSLRVIEAGYHSALYHDLFVYHKRRDTYEKFFAQVRHSGRARITLGKLHPGSTKPVHYLPSLFVVGNFICFLFLAQGGLLLPLIYALLILFDVYGRGDSLELAVNCVAAAYIQLFGYGIGFIEAMIGRGGKSE